MQPHEYPRRILLITIGMTPQIVTETLYQLAVKSEPAFIPTEVHIITTAQGADSARLALLFNNNDGPAGGASVGYGGWFDRLICDYGLSGVVFDASHIHVITDADGRTISDSECSEHHSAVSDFITRKVREFAQDSQSALHVSLAGGRKTMSFYAGYALSLYGRTQDRLSHVLVDKVFQHLPTFFYPPPIHKVFMVDGQYISTKSVNIVVSDIPFVRMQKHIPHHLLSGQEGFQATVNKIEQLSQTPEVLIDIQQQTIAFNDISIELSPKELGFYLWMCARTKQCLPAVCFEEANYWPEFMVYYVLLVGEYSEKYEQAEKELASIQTKNEYGQLRLSEQRDCFLPHRSRLNKKLR